jgi:TonB family protein
VRNFTAILLLGQLASVAAAAPNPETAQWQLATPFVIPAAPDRCVALMALRRGDDMLRVGLENRPSTDEFVVLIEAPGKFGDRTWATAKILLGGHRLAADNVIFEPSALPGTMIYRLQTNRAELESGGTNAELQVRSGSLRIAFPITGLDSAIYKLDACASALMAQWGYSKEFQGNLASYPRIEGKLGDYASPNDYPISALQSGAMGDVHTLVTVSPRGRALGCRVVRSSGNQELDAKTCKILSERARYVPGKSIDGAAVIAPAYVTFRWEIPQF